MMLYPNLDIFDFLKILVLLVFVVVIILRTMGPTKNKAAIDRSIAILRERYPLPESPYAPEPALYEQYMEDCTNPELLTALAYGILRYCGMEPQNLSVITKTDRQLQDAAGTYSSDGYSSTISIRVTPSSRHNILHSVLIHECMHYFLLHSGLRLEDTYQNEILTDTATVYLGFYEYMYDGYLMVGYLRDSELKYIHDKLKSF